MGTPETLLQCFEEAVSDDVVRAVVLRGARGEARTAAIGEFSRVLAPRGVPVTVTDCELHGGFAHGCMDVFLRARLGLELDATAARTSETIARATEDAFSRACLAWALGQRADAPGLAALDVRSRDEALVAELGRLVTGKSSWVWVLDEASAIDIESVQLVEWLTAQQGPGALVVLALSNEDAERLEPRLKPLRLADRCRDLNLRAPTPAARPAPPPSALFDLLSAAGRLPIDALDELLGPGTGEALATLEAAGHVRVGVTRRAPRGEVLYTTNLRRERLKPELLAPLLRWAESKLGEVDWRGLAATLCTLDEARATFAWELRARSSSTWVEQLSVGAQARGAVTMADASPRQLDALRRAEQLSSGVRRLVLGRRVSEEELYRGDHTRAMTTAQAALRATTSGSVIVSHPWVGALLHDVPDELERWDHLTPDEAQAGLELARAEAVCHLGAARDTAGAFDAVRARLNRLPAGRVRAALWMRLARSLVWFRAEMLGDAAGARDACDEVRANTEPGELETGPHAVAFLRAEEIAAARSGDTNRARQLADDLVRVSQQRGDTREMCVALNTRSLMYLRDGELAQARRGFERSLDLARSIGFRRREAIALHNLGLVQCLLGEYGASVACQERYLALSESIGNQVARGYGPAALAMVLVQQRDLTRADANLNRARKAAEDEGWPAILAWTRHLSGLLRLARWCQQRDSLTLSLARTDLLACLDMLADRKSGWSEELDPAETAAALGVCWLLAGNQAQAQRALAEATQFEGASLVSARHVEALRAVIEKRRPDAVLAWFEEHGQLRAHELWTQWLAALG